MAIDPKNLAGTATLTFDDEFNSFSAWNGSSGTWATSPWYAPANGTFSGTSGADKIHGTAANDVINGLGGADFLYGEGGADTVNGGGCVDLIFGGTGSDTLTGGANADYFVFNIAFMYAGIDRITDFSHTDDTIRLENAVFTVLTTVGWLPTSAFCRGAAAHDATDRIIYNPANGALSYDSDGTGAAAPIQFAQLGTGINLTATDFYVI